MKSLTIKVKFRKKKLVYNDVKFYSKSKQFLEIITNGVPNRNNSHLPIQKKIEIKLTEIQSIEEFEV